jgi:hypothetical protein
VAAPPRRCQPQSGSLFLADAAGLRSGHPLGADGNPVVCSSRPTRPGSVAATPAGDGAINVRLFPANAAGLRSGARAWSTFASSLILFPANVAGLRSGHFEVGTGTVAAVGEVASVSEGEQVQVGEIPAGEGGVDRGGVVAEGVRAGDGEDSA